MKRRQLLPEPPNSKALCCTHRRVQVLASGSLGTVHFEPQLIDLSTVRVGAETDACVYLENTSACSVYYLLDYTIDKMNQARPLHPPARPPPPRGCPFLWCPLVGALAAETVGCAGARGRRAPECRPLCAVPRLRQALRADPGQLPAAPQFTRLRPSPDLLLCRRLVPHVDFAAAARRCRRRTALGSR